MNKIFVCVPTMNDFEYLSTIERCLDYSSNPDKLSISTVIFWKPSDISNGKIPFFINIKNILDKNFKKVNYEIQPWSLYPGVGYGRLAPTKFFNNEKYFLSIDSHTNFNKNWDEEIVELYENSRKHFGKLRVLTTYLSPYKNIKSYEKNSHNNVFFPEEDVANRWAFFDFYKNLGSREIKSSIFPLPNDQLIDQKNIKYLSEYFIDKEYLPAKKISAHFYFTESNPWLTKYNLNLNKHIKFWGEEFYQSSLAYARGYNLVWYKTQVLHHQYEIEGSSRNFDECHLNNFSSPEEKIDIFKKYVEKSINHSTSQSLHINDKQIIEELLFGDRSELKYTPRSINGFLKYSGIDILNKKTSPWWKIPEVNVVYK